MHSNKFLTDHFLPKHRLTSKPFSSNNYPSKILASWFITFSSTQKLQDQKQNKCKFFCLFCPIWENSQQTHIKCIIKYVKTHTHTLYSNHGSVPLSMKKPSCKAFFFFPHLFGLWRWHTYVPRTSLKSYFSFTSVVFFFQAWHSSPSGIFLLLRSETMLVIGEEDKEEMIVSTNTTNNKKNSLHLLHLPSGGFLIPFSICVDTFIMFITWWWHLGNTEITSLIISTLWDKAGLFVKHILRGN